VTPRGAPSITHLQSLRSATAAAPPLALAMRWGVPDLHLIRQSLQLGRVRLEVGIDAAQAGRAVQSRRELLVEPLLRLCDRKFRNLDWADRSGRRLGRVADRRLPARASSGAEARSDGLNDAVSSICLRSRQLSAR
jgi:hypothetical protein